MNKNLNNKKVLFVVTEDWYFLSHRLALAKEVQRSGGSVSLACKEGENSLELEQENIKRYPINFNRKSINPFVELRSIIDLWKIITTKFDLIHAVALKPVLYVACASFFKRKCPPIIGTITGLGHAFIAEGFRGILLRHIVKILFRLFIHRKNIFLIVQNIDDYKMLTKLGFACRSQIALVPGSGVDTQIFHPTKEIDDDIPTILLPARMLREKGILEAVAAAEILFKRGLKFRMLLAGPADQGNQSSISEEQLRKWSHADYIQWLGPIPRSQMPEVLAASHVVCLPSYREGVPMALLEAASSGRPIVTCDVPGCREVVIDGRNGFLVPARNSKSLADALENLIVSKKLRMNFGKESRDIAVQKFSKEAINCETLSIYQRVLNDKSA